MRPKKEYWQKMPRKKKKKAKKILAARFNMKTKYIRLETFAKNILIMVN